jgi:hypothetical protein
MIKTTEAKERQKNRSKTFTGIAEAMADQWGSLGKPDWFCADGERR